MDIWHLTFSSCGRQVIFASDAGVLSGVHALARGAGPSVVLFCIVDDHVHVVVRADNHGRVAASVLRALRAVAEVEIDSAHRRRVASRGHLEWLANHYILMQPIKHGLPVHPALWCGSCFFDLIGARRISGLSLQLKTVLPRYRMRQAFAAVGLPPVSLADPNSEDLRRLGASRIVSASAAALGSEHALSRLRLATRARLVAAALCAEAGFPSSVLALELGIRVGSVSNLIRRGADPRDRRAAVKQIALEAAVARQTQASKLDLTHL